VLIATYIVALIGTFYTILLEGLGLFLGLIN